MQYLSDALDERFDSAAGMLDDYDKFRIVTHYDADGISAAAVLARTLMKNNKGFHTTFSSSFPDTIPKGLPLIFTDIGNSHLKSIASISEPAIVLDHHKVDASIDGKDEKVFINPHEFGIDGSREVSGGTLALILSVKYDETNWAKAIYGLAGAAADKQNVGGFTGLNKELLEDALDRKKLVSKEGLYLDGDGIKDALIKACDPYFPGISGRVDEVERIIKELRIDPDAPVDEIPKEKERKLISLLVLTLLEHDIPHHVIESIKGSKFFHPDSNMSVDILYKLLNSCARVSRPGLGLSLCLGDEDARSTAVELRENYRRDMVKRLNELEKDGTQEMDHIQYFFEERKTRKGELAGLGMLYFFDQSKPVFGITKLDDRIDISCRGTRYLVGKGLDLGNICNQVCGKLDGSGGGHDIAAGATIPKDKLDDFLQTVDRMVGEQIKR